ncbi:MAG: molybdopterin molybdotransferase [Solirubrobacteraceae bacterium]|nr:molybdopterin molybdotransferase [Solirubrobacteraceae bacterium]
MRTAAAPDREALPALSELCGVSPDRAIGAWRAACGRARGRARLPTMTVSAADGLGAVLAEPVWARRSSPPFPAAAMDGIAVRTVDTRGASPARPVRLAPGTFDVVDTGNPLPPGRDAVVMRERVQRQGEAADVEAEAEVWHHVRPVGEDIALGELLLVPGHRLRPVDLAAAAAAGVTELTVRRPPRVAILPTGDELRPADAILAGGELPDTNSPMLDGLCREAGCETQVWTILPDDPERLSTALATAAARADLVLLVAGTSAGRHDYAPDVLRRCGRIVVRGVAIRPGHPAVLGVVGQTAVMACPGYPVSAALAFEELARPLIAWLQGAGASRRPSVPARLANHVRSKPGARHLLRVRLGTVDGARVAMPLRGGASVLSSLVHADALLPVPPDRRELSIAEAVDPELWGVRSAPDDALLLAGVRDRALELLAVAFAGARERPARIALCDAATEDAVGWVRDGICHAAAVVGTDGTPPARVGPLMAVRIAECAVGVAVAANRPLGAPAELLRAGHRVAVAPAGTPARRVLDDTLRATGVSGLDLLEARSDAAALATVAAGYADCAVSTMPAARHAGLRARPLGRAALDLVIHRRVARRDPLVQVLLEMLASRSLAVALERAGFDTCHRADPRVA